MNEEEKNECLTKAELQEKIDSLQKELTETKKSKDYWYDLWRTASTKVDVYKNRLRCLQHTCKTMGDLIGELDINAVVTEEEV